MTALSSTELLERVMPGAALCAFNVETFDTLKPAMEAAAETGAPIIVSWTVPAARYWTFPLVVDVVASLGRRYGNQYALHLDHCESVDDAYASVEAGFTSVNFLNEGAMDDMAYRARAIELRSGLGREVSVELVLGTLGHVHDGVARPLPTVEDVARFATETQPDIVGFECGSLHGMAAREQDVAVDLISQVRDQTGLPIVLHGSSGVARDALVQAIDAGVRKVNVETALRSAYLESLRRGLAQGGDLVRKPRVLAEWTDSRMVAVYTELIETITRGETRGAA